MSTAKGNSVRNRPQKHQNRTSFKNSLHDTSQRTKFINSIEVCNVCQHCKEIIEWKIKYKKYKPLTQPAKCVKCDQKNVRYAYHVMCTECGKKLGLCTKCCKAKDIIPAPFSKQEQHKLDAEMQQLLQTLPERRRRTFIRYMNKQVTEDKDKQKQNLMTKFNSFKVSDDNVDFDSDLDDFEDNATSCTDEED